ncbi:MAG TPA: SigE family RNA polymerase sigma factor [Jiangellales bacterium]|nr:SigE family RNA polymerase sigma factor [Jiangellales bacterium]
MRLAPSGPVPPEGFTEFVTARSTALLRTAWLLTGDRGKAEDLLQTVLSAAWPRWSRIAGGGNPEAYVRRALFTTYLSWRRRRWRFEVPEADQTAAASTAGDIADACADRDAVRRALAGLSYQQRAVLVLRYVEDQSVEQTADVLGCSAATVKVQAGRALARLRADPNFRFSQVTS